MPASFFNAYQQTFDGLAASGTANTWINDITLPGWHLFRQPSGAPIAVSTYNADTGTSNSGAFISYGASSNTDRALGGLGSGGAFFSGPSPAPSVASGAVAGWLALALSNASGSAISSLNISFNGEQWRNGGNATTQAMVLEYGYGANFDQVATWMAPGGNFNWTSPVATATAGPVDGNSSGRVTGRGGNLDLSATPWAAGSTLWLRWIETNDTGNDHGLAIDDVSISLPSPVAQSEVAIQAIDAVAAEYGDGAGIRISRTGSTAVELVVPISLLTGADLATIADLAAPFPSSIIIPADAASVDLALSLLDDSLDEGTETLRIQITAPAGTTLATSGASVDLTLVDNDRISPISAVQGTGATSPLLGQNVTLRAVVVGDFQLGSELSGFYLQEETVDWDTNALSSEGLYVAYPLSGNNLNVELGERVLLTGLVGERFGQTAITSVGAIAVEVQGLLADTQRIDIPDLQTQRSSALDLEPYEGMWVRFPETLSVNGLFGQFRFGEIELSTGGLPQQPTNVMKPGPEAYAAEQATALRELVLDDGSNSSYRPGSAATAAAPVRDQLLRRGDTITTAEGILAYDFSKYRLHPTAPVSFVSENPRPVAPAVPAAGQIRLASFNVLNTFSTLNAGGALTDSGLAPRGANSASELERQLNKLTTALVGLNADVIGLMEVENDTNDATLATIVQRLNAAQVGGSGRAYSFVPTGMIGTDAIKVGLIYNNRAVAPSGAAQILGSQAFVDPLTSGTPKNRPALAQAFRELASGEVVNVVVNHLKSKGATDATGADLDQRDGQAAFNATRTAAANRLLEWIASNPTGNNDSDWVILGDLNAYAEEDPIRVMETAGYLNVLPTFTAEPPASYAFFSPVDMSGALDHMLISSSLVTQATSALDWSINAAEGAFRDYNLDSNSNGNAAVRDFFESNPFRTSDHDPLLLDLDLGRTPTAGLSFSKIIVSKLPNQNTVSLKTRVIPPTEYKGLIDVQWEVSTSKDFAAGTVSDRGSFVTSNASDWSVEIEATDVIAETAYHYRFTAGDQVSQGMFTVSTTGKVEPVIAWQSEWRELDLNFGLAFDSQGSAARVDPSAYGVNSRDGVQLADVKVQGSSGPDRIIVGTGSSVEAGDGNDELDNLGGLGGNFLGGGLGEDQFYLRPANDQVIGGSEGQSGLSLPDKMRDRYFIDTSDNNGTGPLRIVDFEPGIDSLYLDGIESSDPWPVTTRLALTQGIAINAAPRITTANISLDLIPGIEIGAELARTAEDPDGDNLRLVKIAGPSWITTSGTSIKATTPVDLTSEAAKALDIRFAFTDGQALSHDTLAITANLSNDSFINGVASGDPLQDSVILWTRLNPKGRSVNTANVNWEVSTNNQFDAESIVDRGVFSTGTFRDWTVKVEANGLTPSRTYYYRFSHDGQNSPVGQTRTLAEISSTARIALFSCANFTAQPEFTVYGKAAEINQEKPYDAWVHVGDYIYEYGEGGYPSAEGSLADRGFIPNHELLSLDDYRQRYAQYHTDIQLQKLRQTAPLIAIWDDHETANDSYADGAQNHQPATEGAWATRVANALQAYHEWMPTREQQTPAKAYRSFDFGDIFSLHMLETRLTARDRQLSYTNATTPADVAAIVNEAYNGDRSMIGQEQLAWLRDAMSSSKAAWQALGSGTLMANMAIPAELLLNATNPAIVAKYTAPLQKLAQGVPLTPAEQSLFSESTKIPYNLDAWDGYGAERQQIIEAALELGKRIVSLAGDTHNAWGSILDSRAGTKAGVEFGGPGVSSPGIESLYADPTVLEQLFLGYVTDLRYAELQHRGFVDLTLTKDSITADYNYLIGTDAVSQQDLWNTETLFADASLTLTELKRQEGSIDFTAVTDRSVPIILDVDSTNRQGRLYDERLLPESGSLKLRLNKGGFSGDLPTNSKSTDFIQLEYTLGGVLQEVVTTEQIKDDRGNLETIADAARGLINQIINNYIHTRDGDDQIIGSAGVDFIRAGAGNDVIDAGVGDDIVRSGSGSDQVTLGPGADKLLITRDQLNGIDLLLDFTAEDQLILADGIRVSGGIDTKHLQVSDTTGNTQELVLAGSSTAQWTNMLIKLV